MVTLVVFGVVIAAVVTLVVCINESNKTRHIPPEIPEDSCNSEYGINFTVEDIESSLKPVTLRWKKCYRDVMSCEYKGNIILYYNNIRVFGCIIDDYDFHETTTFRIRKLIDLIDECES